jgi:single-stranded DNA-binding protein
MEKTKYGVEHNQVVIEGFVHKAPEYHHSVYGEKIYAMTVSIPRLNKDVSDYLNVEVSERLTDIEDLTAGAPVRIEGQFRSFNQKDTEDGRAHLQLSVFARELSIIEENDTNGVNTIYLEGFLCKAPVYRKTPLGREICDMLVAVNRPYNKSDYIPTIAWGRNARFTSNLDVGTGVVIEGRIQSREYQKRIGEDEYENRVAYEVSVSRISVFEEGNKEE